MSIRSCFRKQGYLNSCSLLSPLRLGFWNNAPRLGLSTESMFELVDMEVGFWKIRSGLSEIMDKGNNSLRMNVLPHRYQGIVETFNPVTKKGTVLIKSRKHGKELETLELTEEDSMALVYWNASNCYIDVEGSMPLTFYRNADRLIPGEKVEFNLNLTVLGKSAIQLIPLGAQSLRCRFGVSLKSLFSQVEELGTSMEATNLNRQLNFGDSSTSENMDDEIFFCSTNYLKKDEAMQEALDALAKYRI